MTNRVAYAEAALWGANASLTEKSGAAAREIAQSPLKSMELLASDAQPDHEQEKAAQGNQTGHRGHACNRPYGKYYGAGQGGTDAPRFRRSIASDGCNPNDPDLWDLRTRRTNRRPAQPNP